MTPRTHVVPEGVRQAESRILAEAIGAIGQCEHDDIDVRHAVGSAFDDHETVYGRCARCLKFVVSTLNFGGGSWIESREMTPQERYRHQTPDERMHEAMTAPDTVIRGHRFPAND